MSDDQLSWENLFNNSESKAAPSSDSSSAAQKPEKPKKSDRARSSAAATNSVARVKVASMPLTATPARGPRARYAVEDSLAALSRPAKGSSMVVSSTASPATSSMARNSSGAEDDESDALALSENEPQILSVYELNKAIRSTLEGKFRTIWVKGEISNFKAHTSGHFYFSLKDSKAQVSVVMFRGFNQQLKFRPEDGMEVIIRGRVTVYEPRGNYQIFCEMMEPVGAGALQKAFDQLKAKLQAEGLFDQKRKRPLPSLPRHIAIVTSPTGAAIRDMINVLGRRFKAAKITLVPTKVQGEQAVGEICAAIDLANRLPDVDVMIVGRGGGSIEDLWCFNDERVARAIAATRVPVISAVGHEIDFTIADFVADLRAPTPSAAAELVVKNAADLQSKIETLQRRLRLAISRTVQSVQQRAQSLAKRLIDPQRRIQDSMLRCDELTQRLEAGWRRQIENRRMKIALFREKLGNPEQRIQAKRQALEALNQRLATGWKTLHARKHGDVEKQMALLDSLSPLRVVARGYSFVTLHEQVVNDVAQVKEGDVVCIQFAHGRASAAITRIENNKGVTDRE